MTRAAIYARYSSDLQSDRSIEDQVALCRGYAERHKMTVVEVYGDRAQSGSSTVNRAGWQKLMADADRRPFDIVVAEDIDRISRDQADYHSAVKRLAFLDIRIHTAHGGEVSGVEGSIRSMMSELFLDNLRHKTRRGLAGVVRSGRHAGGRAYGYRLIPGKPGEFTIDEDEAAIVRRIFAEYNAGKTPRAIARDLNRDQIPSPRGGTWNASTINGNSARGLGIIQNELYAGVIVWNRTRKIRSPDTGKRLQRPNPPSAWHRQEAPHFAIVDRDVFDRVQKRKAERSVGHPSHHRRPRHILSGLLKCGACGGGMSAAGKDKSGRIRVRCSSHIESGNCPDPRTHYLCTVEDAVLSGLRREMQHPAAIAEYVKTYVEERRRLAQRVTRDRAQIERRLAAAQRTLDIAVKHLLKGTLTEEEAEKEIGSTRAERDKLRAELTAAPEAETAVSLHPAALRAYEAALECLQHTLATGIAAGDTEGTQAVRDLVEAVTVRPRAGGGVEVEISGKLTALLGDHAYPDRIRSIGGIAGAQGRN